MGGSKCYTKVNATPRKVTGGGTGYRSLFWPDRRATLLTHRSSEMLTSSVKSGSQQRKCCRLDATAFLRW